MVVLTETVRKLSEDRLEINVYPLFNITADDWEQLHVWDSVLGSIDWSQNITLTKVSLIVFQLSGEFFDLNSVNSAGMALKVGDWWIAGSCNDGVTESDPEDILGVALLPAGTYAVQAWGWNVQNVRLKLGITNFLDQTGDTQNSNTQNVNSLTTVTFVNEDVVGLLRQSAIGTVKRHVIRVNCLVRTQGANDHDIEYVYDNDPSTADLKVSIWKNDGAEYWVANHDQLASMDESNGNQGEYCTVEDIASTINIKIKVYNTTLAQINNVEVYWSIVASPWIGCACWADPVLISIPQMSTVNAVMTPLDSDITKYLSVGNLRGVEEMVVDEISGLESIRFSGNLAALAQQGLYLLHKGWRGSVSAIAGDRRG